MGNDLVTVAIPAYNHQDYVQETINSVIEQTHTNIELIILNDGSADNTDAKIKELLPECKKRFARLEYVSKENEGLGATWNRAIDWADGDYLYTIASDDVAHPQAIEILYDFLSRHKEYALAVGDNQIIDEDGERCYWDKERRCWDKQGNITTTDKSMVRTFVEYQKKSRKGRRRYKPRRYGTYKTLINGNYIANGKMFRVRSLIKVGKYIPGMKLEDWYINLQLAKFYKLKHIDKILLSYRWHDANSIKNKAYIKGSVRALLEYEKDNHSQWFEKYATRRTKAKCGR